MLVYLVGGAVRDALLGRPVKDRDWVVVGATAAHLIEQGFKPVGKDFPVFLHPQTQEEYALARTERKVASGYQGFKCYAAPDVTLEQDLQRRDLTINAMAQTLDGQLIDPFGGQADLRDKCLRHVSPAFIEDPVRALRIARFSARFSGFHIAPETLGLLDKMRDLGEFQALVPERVCQELLSAVGESNPERFFQVLEQLGVLEHVSKIWAHSPDCTGIQALNPSATMERFWWCCVGQNLERVKAGLDPLRIPKAWHAPACWMSEAAWETMPIEAGPLLELCQRYDAWRRPDRFKAWLSVCEQHPRIVPRHTGYFEKLAQVHEVTCYVDVPALQAQGHVGPDLGQAIWDQRKRLAVQALER